MDQASCVQRNISFDWLIVLTNHLHSHKASTPNEQLCIVTKCTNKNMGFVDRKGMFSRRPTENSFALSSKNADGDWNIERRGS